MIYENLIIRENRIEEICEELKSHGSSNYTMEEKVECLVNHLCSKILNTNKCYRIHLHEFVRREIIFSEELLMFKQSLVSSSQEAKLKIEDEDQGFIKVECSNKLNAEQLPVLSPLQLKLLKIYSLNVNDADDFAEMLMEKQKLTHQEYEELQIVRHYEF